MATRAEEYVQNSGKNENRNYENQKNLEKDELNVNSHCIDMLECYNFKITDKKGDGVKGWYRLILDGKKPRFLTSFFSFV